MKFIKLMFFPAILLFCACTGSVNIAAEKQNLLDLDRAFSKKSAEAGVAIAYKNFFSKDATLLPMGAFPISGRDSIFARVSRSRGLELIWTPEDAGVARSGEFGYTWGYYKSIMTGFEGDPFNGIKYGKYLNVWAKNEDGDWRVIMNIGNGNPNPGLKK